MIIDSNDARTIFTGLPPASALITNGNQPYTRNMLVSDGTIPTVTNPYRTSRYIDREKVTAIKDKYPAFADIATKFLTMYDLYQAEVNV